MFLTKAQVKDLTGKGYHKLQVEVLCRMGVPHWIRPDGRPMVLESALQNPPNQPHTQDDNPNWDAI